MRECKGATKTRRTRILLHETPAERLTRYVEPQLRKIRQQREERERDQGPMDWGDRLNAVRAFCNIGIFVGCLGVLYLIGVLVLFCIGVVLSNM